MTGADVQSPKEMILTAERLRCIVSYDPETGEFRRLAPSGRWKAGDIAGTVRVDGYQIIRLSRTDYLGHRLAWLYMTGEWPKSGIDHRDRVRSNNRWANLREATQRQQHHNKSGWGRSGFKGAHWHARTGKWVARIKVDGRNRHIGVFDTAEAAHAAYCAEARRAFGGFASSGRP